MGSEPIHAAGGSLARWRLGSRAGRDGDLHWIFGRLIGDSVDCTTIKASKANIRKRPTTRAPLWFTVEKYTSFKKVGTEEKWVKLEYEGEIMWVFHTLVWPG